MWDLPPKHHEIYIHDTDCPGRKVHKANLLLNTGSNIWKDSRNKEPSKLKAISFAIVENSDSKHQDQNTSNIQPSTNFIIRNLIILMNFKNIYFKATVVKTDEKEESTC